MIPVRPLAFAYLRVSGRSQAAEDKDGFTRQKTAIDAYARAGGLTVARIFEERGVSGTKEALDRPAWTAMVAEILTTGVQTIIIERLDRLARDYYIQEHILRDLKKRGITLLSTAEPDLGSDDPTRVLFRTIVGGVAQYEKSMLVAKLAAARKRRRDKGIRCDGAKPYGELPAEADAVMKIQDWRKLGRTYQAIADGLKDAGIPPRRGRKWDPGVVRRIARRK